MKTYYVINVTLSFGFGGFIKKACMSQEEAEKVLDMLQHKYRNITECNISKVEAKNKKEAESNCPSLFAGEFKNADKIRA